MATKKIETTALKVKQPIGTFLIASLTAEQIIDISYVHRRKLERNEKSELDEYIGIQRQLSSNRIADLEGYVGTIDATFPSSIILSIDEQNVLWDEKSKKLILQETDQIKFGNIAQIIDGQHRIEGLKALKENVDFEVNVSIFVGIDIATQAYLFATVNLAQTKVNKSLVYDLFEHEKNRSPQKTAHDIAVNLDRLETSPFYHRIKRLGHKTKDRKNEPLTQALVVERILELTSEHPYKDRDREKRKLIGKINVSYDELLKRPFREMYFEKKDTDIAKILINYFNAVEQKWPESWKGITTTGNMLPRTNGFIGLMKFFKDAYLKLCPDNIGRVPSQDEFYNLFKISSLTQEHLTTDRYNAGAGGSNHFYQDLRDEIIDKKEISL